MRISAIVLTKNEEKNIRRCLLSLNFASEIIIIDNESKDKTEKIAAEFTQKIYKFKGTDFASGRMLGRERANFEWLLYIDADEVITDKLQEEIKESIKTDYSAFSLIRQNYFYGQKWPKKETVLRLIKKNCLKTWVGAVHETPIVDGKIGLLKNPLLHHTHNDLKRMVDKTNLWSEVEAHERFKTKHSPVVWWRFIRVMLTSFFQTLFIEKAILKGTTGMIESIYQSFSMFITYAKLWEMQNRLKKY